LHPIPHGRAYLRCLEPYERLAAGDGYYGQYYGVKLWRIGQFSVKNYGDKTVPENQAMLPSLPSAEIKTILTGLKPALQAKYGITALGLFGSFVRDEQDDASDVDVLLEYNPQTSRLDLFDVVALRDYLSAAVGRPVDIAFKHALKKHIGRRILAEVQYL
jgi:predicted nucleotidyltransferase